MNLHPRKLRLPRKRWLLLVGGTLLVLLLVAVRVFFGVFNPFDPRNRTFRRWFTDPGSRPALITTQVEPCAGAPFVLPAPGFIGLLYGDVRGPYSIIRRHQGIDIFGDAPLGTVPVVAAYDGFLTREKDWVSAVIIRHPEDPLDASRQIWTFYTHMADSAGVSFIHEAFPQGTSEVFVEQGTLLGFMGNYSGNPSSPTGHHVHFSVVKDDGQGRYSNELKFGNTLDPGSYLGMTVDYQSNPALPIGCNAGGRTE